MTDHMTHRPTPGPTTADDTVLVTGAGGNTGRLVVEGLTALGVPVRAASRRGTAAPAGAGAGLFTSAHFDWHDPGTHADVLDGVGRIYLVPPTGAAEPATVMVPFLRRARERGVRRAVLLSSSAIPEGGPGPGQVDRALAGIFPEWTVLQPSWFMQNFIGGHQHGESIRTRDAILTATEKGRVGFVDAADIAAVAVRALTDEPAHNTAHVITGPEALSYDDIAAMVARVTGRPVRHESLSYEQQRDRFAADMPAEFATLLADLDRAIASGVEDRTTRTVETVTGRPPRSFADFAEAHAASFVGD
ncbi:NAD(P)H-binding protein [Streptomyces scopuliridis]